MTIIVTGAAGFIGFHTSLALLKQGKKVIGIDNLNDYYSPLLKKARLAQLTCYTESKQFIFYEEDITHLAFLKNLSTIHSDDPITHIIHLAAQAGVRYSLENPSAYIHSNITGHNAILEWCRSLPHLEHCVFASSSSVYGANTQIPFHTDHKTDHPLSLYAATKQAGERLSYSYSHLFGIALTGLRFFTVYGPWGRPDMAIYNFTDNLYKNKTITLYNNGEMERDFTYIDDVVDAILSATFHPPTSKNPPFALYNVGNDRPISIKKIIELLEIKTGRHAKIQYEPMHPGDVQRTWADISNTRKDLKYDPSVSMEKGLDFFIEWYKNYYN